jgi:outer membrane protein OmpA-like peptidoglycan-associated protein
MLKRNRAKPQSAAEAEPNEGSPQPRGSGVEAEVGFGTVVDGTGEWSSLDRADQAAADATASVASAAAPSRTVPLITLVVGSVALYAFGATAVRNRIEGSLEKRTNNALTEAGITGADVRYNGRDATVRVPPNVDPARVASLVRTAGADPAAPHYSGPRAVAVVIDADRPPAVTTTTVPVIPGTANAVLTDTGTILLTGAFESEAALEAFRQGVLQQSPTTSIEVKADVRAGGVTGRTATWMGRSIGEFLRVGASAVSVTGDGDALAVEGDVPTLAVRDSLNAFVRTSGLTVESSLPIVRPTEPKSEGVGPDLFGEDSPAESLQEQASAILADSNISFRPDSATITPEGLVVVERLAELLKSNPAAKVAVSGHTDSNGSPERNLALSVARADAVRDELVALGVESSRITTQGEGDTKPLVPNDTPANRRINRRIEVQITSG